MPRCTDFPDPLKDLVIEETNKNSHDILCYKDNCNCVIIKRGTAELVAKNDYMLPLFPLDETTSSDHQEDTHYWKLDNMMKFENVGFSHLVELQKRGLPDKTTPLKMLSCADCDVGPIGYHDAAAENKEFLVSMRRVRYK